jgi:hypothetical protein
MYTRYLAHYDRDYDLASYETKKFEEAFFSSNKEKIKNEKLYYANWIKTSLPPIVENISEENEDTFLSSLQNSDLLMDLVEKIDTKIKFKRSKLRTINKISNANGIIECLKYLNKKFNNRFKSIHYTDFVNRDRKNILSFLFLIKNSYETQIKNHIIECSSVNIREKESKEDFEQKNEIKHNYIPSTNDLASDYDDLKESGFETESESLTLDTSDSNVDILQVIVNNEDIYDQMKFKKRDSFIDEIPDTKIDLIYNDQYFSTEGDKVSRNDNFSEKDSVNVDEVPAQENFHFANSIANKNSKILVISIQNEITNNAEELEYKNNSETSSHIFENQDFIKIETQSLDEQNILKNTESILKENQNQIKEHISLEMKIERSPCEFVAESISKCAIQRICENLDELKELTIEKKDTNFHENSEFPTEVKAQTTNAFDSINEVHKFETEEKKKYEFNVIIDRNEQLTNANEKTLEVFNQNSGLTFEDLKKTNEMTNVDQKDLVQEKLLNPFSMQEQFNEDLSSIADCLHENHSNVLEIKISDLNEEEVKFKDSKRLISNRTVNCICSEKNEEINQKEILSKENSVNTDEITTQTQIFDLIIEDKKKSILIEKSEIYEENILKKDILCETKELYLSKENRSDNEEKTTIISESLEKGKTNTDLVDILDKIKETLTIQHEIETKILQKEIFANKEEPTEKELHCIKSNEKKDDENEDKNNTEYFHEINEDSGIEDKRETEVTIIDNEIESHVNLHVKTEEDKISIEKILKKDTLKIDEKINQFEFISKNTLMVNDEDTAPICDSTIGDKVESDKREDNILNEINENETKKETVFIKNEIELFIQTVVEEEKVETDENRVNNSSYTTKEQLTQKNEQINQITSELLIENYVNIDSDLKKDEFNSDIKIEHEQDKISFGFSLGSDLLSKSNDLFTCKDEIEIVLQIQEYDIIKEVNEETDINTNEIVSPSNNVGSESLIENYTENEIKTKILTEQNILNTNKQDAMHNRDEYESKNPETDTETQKDNIGITSSYVVEDLMQISEKIVLIASNDKFLNIGNDRIEKESTDSKLETKIENEKIANKVLIENECKPEEIQLLNNYLKEQTIIENSLITIKVEYQDLPLLNSQTTFKDSIEAIKTETTSSIKMLNTVKLDENIKTSSEINHEIREIQTDKIQIDESFHFEKNKFDKTDLGGLFINGGSDLPNQSSVEENKNNFKEDILDKSQKSKVNNQLKIHEECEVKIIVQEMKENINTAEIAKLKVNKSENKETLSKKNNLKKLNNKSSNELIKENSQVHIQFEKHEKIDECNNILVEKVPNEIKRNQPDIKLSQIESEKTKKNNNSKKSNKQKVVEATETTSNGLHQSIISSTFSEPNKKTSIVTESNPKLNQNEFKITDNKVRLEISNPVGIQSKENKQDKAEKIIKNCKLDETKIIENYGEKEFKENIVANGKTVQENNNHLKNSKKFKSKIKNIQENNNILKTEIKEENQKSKTEPEPKSDTSVKTGEKTRSIKSSPKKIETDTIIQLKATENPKQSKQLKKSTLIATNRITNNEKKSLRSSLSWNIFIIIFIFIFILVGFNYIYNLYSF